MICATSVLVTCAAGQRPDALTAARNRLVNNDIVAAGISDQRVIEALDLLRAILASQLAAEASLTQSLHIE